MLPPSHAADAALPPAVAGPAFLPDGTEVWVRPVQEQDRELLTEFAQQDAPARSGLRPAVDASIPPTVEDGLPSLGAPSRCCLLVLGETAGRITLLGIGEYARLRRDPTVAQVTVRVAGTYRGRGIASLLLARLSRAALTSRIRSFEALPQGSDPELLEVFRGETVPFAAASREPEGPWVIPLAPKESPDEDEASASPRPGRRRLTAPSARRAHPHPVARLRSA